MNIIKNIVPKSKYNIKCPYTMHPKFIVVHNTANNASAKNEISYMTRRKDEVSFHYAVDNKNIVQGILENRNAWHSGDGNGKNTGNRNGIAIEICYSKSGGKRFVDAEKNAVKLIVSILKKYKWDITKVKKHQDFSKKYCPHRTLDIGWNRFLKMIENELNPKPTKVKVYKGRSIVDYLKFVGINSSYSNRKKLAIKYGIKRYYGLAWQNTKLLKILRGF